MYILGINAFHGDSSACLLKDGEILCASEEERFRRIKHWAGFPSEAVKFCLEDAGIRPDEIAAIAISRDPSAHNSEKILHALKSPSGWRNTIQRLKNRRSVQSLDQYFRREAGFSPEELGIPVHNVEHHRAHMASAFYVSGFQEAAILSIDGFGDFSSTMIGTGRGMGMEILDRVAYPHSLGVFYTAFTQFLGFPHYGDEYKVMGLAPYGKPVHREKVARLIRLVKGGLFRLELEYFAHPKKGVEMSWNGGIPHIGTLFSDAMIREFGEPRKNEEALSDYHRDLAASVQAVCEDVIFHCLHTVQEKTGMKNLCLAGGVGQNSVANGKILANTAFEKIYIPPASHDAGTSIGAALYVQHAVLGMPVKNSGCSAYLGSRFTNDQIAEFLADKPDRRSFLPDDKLYDYVAHRLEEGAVVGWFQGRAEFGPRALGNRSILADPRRADAKDLLNRKIKKRESFRPFAPSILAEAVPDYFERTDDVPYMEKVFVIRPEKREKIPAVTHVDGTGRLQTVTEASNERYYRLISAFGKRTGVPILLNTSFNENEPIVDIPAHAYDCFRRTDMDLLVLGNHVIER